MITDYERIFQLREPWPPADEDTRERLALYKRNKLLYKGRHNAIWEDAIRRLRDDHRGDLRIILNFHKLLSRLWSDLVCGELPSPSSSDAAQDVAAKRIITKNQLWVTVQDGVVDCSMKGTNILKIRFDKRGIIENIPPEYWFPVVSSSNIKDIRAHIIAYSFPDPTPKSKYEYLKAEIHRPAGPEEPDHKGHVIEHRLYRLKKGKIDSEPLPLDLFPEFAALKPVEDTGLDDFAVVDIQNVALTDELGGQDDYTDINSIVRELEMRYAQILRIEDKFSDPWMYGPPIEEQDPRDGEYYVQGGSRYISVTEGMAPPGMLTWDANLPANFTTIDSLMQRLYEVSQTCKVAFDASLAGSAISGTALRLMMFRPLSKASGLKVRYDAGVKKAIRLCSMMEVINGVGGSAEVEDLSIEWKDGLPEDPVQQSNTQATLITARGMSPQDAMRDRGYSEDRIKRAMTDMSDQVE
jgi:hypothetical protein